MSKPDEHQFTSKMEQSSQAGDLQKLQNQLAQWEAEFADESTTNKDHLWIDPSMTELRDWGALRSRTDKSEPVYLLLTRLLVRAARANQVATAKYLIDKRGVPITPVVAKQALNGDASDVLEMFLEHGWNINEPIMYNHCPVLG